MASIHDNIRSTLEDHLASITGIPEIAWENVNFTPTTGTPYIIPTFRPLMRRPAHRGLNPQHRYDGLFSIDCCSPENQGPGACDAIAELIIDSFESTTDISYAVDTNTTVIVSIDYAERLPGLSQSPWYVIPVNIGWYIYN